MINNSLGNHGTNVHKLWKGSCGFRPNTVLAHFRAATTIWHSPCNSTWPIVGYIIYIIMLHPQRIKRDQPPLQNYPMLTIIVNVYICLYLYAVVILCPCLLVTLQKRNWFVTTQVTANNVMHHPVKVVPSTPIYPGHGVN
jgi:hypothetical protein